jgi:hypothetical protein
LPAEAYWKGVRGFDLQADTRDLFGLPALRRLAPVLIAPKNGVKIASVLDLAGMKVSVVEAEP